MKVLLANEQQVIRSGLQPIQPQIAGDVVSGETEAPVSAPVIRGREEPLDIVLLDPVDPERHGLAGFERVRSHRRDLPIIILSTGSDRRRVAEALDRGAAGFLLRPANAGGAAAFRSRLPLPSCQVDALATLSRRECDVLGLLARGCCNKDIARRLDLQEVTVKAHLRQIFRKLGVSNRTQALRRVLDSGWRSDRSR